MGPQTIILAAMFCLAGCTATPASLGITGPGGGGPPTFVPPPADDDSGVGPPGIPSSGSPYSPSNRPAGDVTRPGDFYGYN